MYVQYSEIHNTWQTFYDNGDFMRINGYYDHYNLDTLDIWLYSQDMKHNRYTGKIERFDNDRERLEVRALIQYRQAQTNEIRYLLHETIFLIQNCHKYTQKLTRNVKHD